MKLKKVILIIGMTASLGVVLSACGNSTNSSQTTSANQPQISKNNSSNQSSNSQQNSGSAQSTSESSSSNSDSQTTNVSPKTIGVFVGLLQSPDWFKESVKSGGMYFGENWKYGDAKTKDFDFITTKGDPTSFIYFKQDGDDITIRFVDPEDGQTVAEAPVKTIHVSLKQLIADYYTRPDQQEEVNGYVSELKNYDD